ncbi:MAG: hypothetical protein CME64_09835 [Halobacteriovoraceae bacterium]|nr:hypothetical protein [Halobacteriovoraceae bacterium]|tara:strand:+ start:57158 stop:58078 length:921 start_codon:yes stop_codon:yes gene_type:complete
MWRSFKSISLFGHGLLPEDESNKGEHGDLDRSPKLFTIAVRQNNGILLIKKKHTFPGTIPLFSEYTFLRGISYFLRSVEIFCERLKYSQGEALVLPLIMAVFVWFLPSLVLIELPMFLNLNWNVEGTAYLFVDSLLKLSLVGIYMKVLSRKQPFKDVLQLTSAQCVDATKNPIVFILAVIISTFMLSNHFFYNVGEALPLGLREVYIVLWKLFISLGMAGILFEVSKRLNTKFLLSFSELVEKFTLAPVDPEVKKVAEIETFAKNELKRYNRENKNVSESSCFSIKISDISEINLSNNEWKKFLEQ